MQQSYLTPIKTMTQIKQKSCKTDLSKHQGDWVCLNCQNLNFSFRKKCNRCKSQSRQENDAKTIYSYYYYNHNNQNNSKKYVMSQELLERQTLKNQNSPSVKSFKFEKYHQQQENVKNQSPVNYENQLSDIMQTPKKKKTPVYTSSQNPKKKDNLPSVSPLVKKYLQHHTTLQKLNQKNIQFDMPEDIYQDYEHIQIRDFDQFLFDINHNNNESTTLLSMGNNKENYFNINDKINNININSQNSLSDKYNFKEIEFNLEMQKIQESIAKIII